jgi:hypothetical protein
MRITSWKILLLLSTILLGCFSQEGARSPLPGRVGPQGEVLVVCSDGVWSRAVGDSLLNILNKPYAVLPQMHTETYEPMFDVVHKNRQDFNKFWKPHRNIIDVEIADRVDTQEASVVFYKEKYSKGQVYIVAKGRTELEVAEAIAQRSSEMLSLFHDVEVKRTTYVTGASVDEVIKREIGEAWGFDILVPKGSYAVRVDTAFTWIDRQLTRFRGSDNHDVQEAFFIHCEPYLGEWQFSLDHLLNRRDELTKEFVNGPTKGSYMKVERRMIPSYEEILFKGEFASEIRGLWRMENDFMGGPFYSLTFYDKPHKRLVTVEGYAYAPYFDKRQYMREVEGIVKSVSPFTSLLIDDKASAVDEPVTIE